MNMLAQRRVPRQRLVTLSVLLTVFLLLFLAGCSNGESSPAPSAASPTPDPVADPEAEVSLGGDAVEVAVDLDEWSVIPERSAVAEGVVKFVATNSGTESHELVVLKTDRAPDDLVMDSTQDIVNEDASGVEIGEIKEDKLPPNSTAEGTFLLTPGDYVLFCNVPGHYRQGMYAGFSVSESTSGSLTIYSGRSETLVAPIIEEFANVTGIKVSVKYAGTPQLVATLLEEGRKSPADVFFAQDPGGLGAIEDMLAPLPQRILDLVPDWARSSEGKWIGVSGRARTVVYNTEALEPSDLPDDMLGFTDPKWKGRIGWAPTNASFQTMVTAMRATWGEEKTRQWLEGIKANDPKVYPKNTPIVAAVGAGEVEVGFVNHYYLFRFLAEEGESFPARNYHPKAGGPGALIMVAGVGVLETSENRENAERFVEFLLSLVGQQYFASQTFEYPLVEGVKIARELVPLSEVNAPSISMRDLADLEGTLRLLQDVGIL